MDRIQTRAFLTVMLLLGAMTVASSAVNFTIVKPTHFVFFLAIALIGATLKVTIPGMTGTLSVNYIFVLIGVAELSSGECLLIACLSTLVQAFYKARTRPRPIKLIFNVASISIAVTAARNVYYSSFLQSHGIGIPVLLTATAITYFFVNTFPVAAIIALTDSKSIFRIWKECYLWSFPFFLIGAAIAWVFHIISSHFGLQIAMLTLPGAYVVYSSYRLYLARLQDEKAHVEQMAGLHLRTIQALALAIDAKDAVTHDHLRRVQTYAVGIARELGLSGLYLEAMRAAAVLHDIGKLAVPEHIISKPGRLTPEEFEKMKIHPTVGAEILEEVGFPYPVVPIVRSHHEKWDGTGYPDGLKGEEIPIGARILSAVDCLDALSSDRQYRKAIPLDQAMAAVAAESGKSFDPRIVEILQARYQELELEIRALPEDHVNKPGLSRNVKIARGGGPDAGFEETRGNASADNKTGFLTLIAAARQEVQTLFELSGDLGHSLCLSETLSIFASKLQTMVPHDLICIYTIQEEMLYPTFVAGKEHGFFSKLRIPVGEGLSGWVAEKNSRIINGNPSVEAGYLNDPAAITNLKSALAIPLEENGSAIGVLTLYSVENNAFSQENLRILQALGPRLGAALKNGRRLSEAEGSASTDFLTGLPNSRFLFLHLDEQMEKCRRRDAHLGVFVCDLNGFKRINDEYGHMEGNRLLKAVADSLRKSCRLDDYVARLGGDEFVIMMPNFQESSMEECIQSFKHAVKLTAVHLGFSELSLSVGAVVFTASGDHSDADALLAEADRRMYADKSRNERRSIPLPLGIPDSARRLAAVREGVLPRLADLVPPSASVN